MQAAGVSVTELTLMFQYIASKLNRIPYGIRNINTYSEGKIEELRNSSELVMFICPADWMMFQVPGGMEFSSLRNNRGEAIRSIIEKLEIMREFRENELLNMLNKQYSGMNFKDPQRIEINSVVLLRNIANESKREPMKLARVLQINESKDNAQRILMLEYNNIKKNKEGNWVGTPITVERSINDIIPIGKAINESLVNLDSRDIEVETEDEEQENIIHEENINDGIEETTGNENLIQTDDNQKEDYDLNGKNDNHKEDNHIPVRKSERIRKRLIDIDPEDIGENDNAKDKDYKA